MQLLEQEILPKLEKLKEAKRNLLEFQGVESELEKTQNLIVAYEYSKFSVYHYNPESN